MASPSCAQALASSASRRLPEFRRSLLASRRPNRSGMAMRRRLFPGRPAAGGPVRPARRGAAGAERLQLDRLYRPRRGPALPAADRHPVRYDVYDSLETLEGKLSAGRSGYDIIVPTSEPTFARLVRAGALRPLDKARMPNLRNLDPRLMARVATVDPGQPLRRDLPVGHGRARHPAGQGPRALARGAAGRARPAAEAGECGAAGEMRPGGDGQRDGCAALGAELAGARTRTPRTRPT